MFETFLLASDADEKEKKKTHLSRMLNEKICSHLGKGTKQQANFHSDGKKVLGPLSTVT